jgi:hypothetical protein
VKANQLVDITKPPLTEQRQELLSARSVIRAELTFGFFELRKKLVE